MLGNARAVLTGCALILLAWLAGCAATRNPAQPLDPVGTAQALEARSLVAPGLKAFIESRLPRPLDSWPPRAWDLDLLTLAALYYDPALDVARARWEVAEARMITAGQIPNPVLGFTPEFNRDAVGVSPWILGLVLSLPLETAGKRALRVEQARHLSEAARFSVARAAWQARSRVRARLLALYGAQSEARLLARQVEIQREIIALFRERLRVGEIARPDLVQAEIEQQRSLLALRQAEQREAEAKAQLAAALGVPARALTGIDFSFASLSTPPSVTAIPSAELERQALTNRADILAALSEYAAADSALRLEIARKTPDLTLGPGYKWDQGARKWSLGLSATLPVFNQNQGPAASAQARREEAKARFTALQARIIGELDQAEASYRAALKGLAAAREAEELATSREATMATRFHAGYADRVALLDSRLQIVLAQEASLQGLIAVQKALGALEDAVERPLAGGEPQAVPYRNPRSERGPAP